MVINSFSFFCKNPLYEPVKVYLCTFKPLNEFYPLALCASFSPVALKTMSMEEGGGSFELLYYYMRNFYSLIGLEQWYFSLI